MTTRHHRLCGCVVSCIGDDEHEPRVTYCRTHDAAPKLRHLLASCLAYFDDMKRGATFQQEAAPDSEWLDPIRALLREVEGETP